MAPRKKCLTQTQVDQLIKDVLSASKAPGFDELLQFAETVNGGSFTKPKPVKPKALTMTAAKKAVLIKFECKNVTELRKNKTFAMAFPGEKVPLTNTEDWKTQYRKWIGVPEDERENTGATCINGIDVLENFRPWHVFGLSAHTASSDDVKESFRQLAKTHHPDMGGDARVFERLQKMRDSLLALMN